MDYTDKHKDIVEAIESAFEEIENPRFQSVDDIIVVDDESHTTYLVFVSGTWDIREIQDNIPVGFEVVNICGRSGKDGPELEIEIKPI